MKKIVLLFSHKLTSLQEKELNKEWDCEKIIYMPDTLKEKWGNIDVKTDLKSFKKYLKENLSKNDLVLIQGEWGATYKMINYSKRKGYIPIYSSSERNSTEFHEGDKVIKSSIFLHIKFVKY